MADYTVKGYRNLHHKLVSKKDVDKYPKGTDLKDIAFDKEFHKKNGPGGYRLATKEDLEDL